MEKFWQKTRFFPNLTNVVEAYFILDELMGFQQLLEIAIVLNGISINYEGKYVHYNIYY